MLLIDDVTITFTTTNPDTEEQTVIGTATVGEKPNSVVASVGSYEAEYVIEILTGTNSEQRARNALEQAIPEFFTNEWKTLYREPVTVEELTDKHWKGEANYVSRSVEGEEVVPDTFSFDTTGGTQHITSSENTTKFAPSGQIAPDFQGAIGVSDKSVAGVDIVTPVYNFSKTVRKDNAALSQSYLVALAQLTGKVNDAPFLGCEAGEVLFRGASGSIEQYLGVNVSGKSDITFLFSANPNRSSYSVGSISGISKKGWDYQWVRYQYDTDSIAKKLIQKPLAVYIEEVYRKGSFSILGIEPPPSEPTTV